MPVARAHTAALIGVQGHVVEVEADLASGLPTVVMTGLPDASLNEARDRVRAAIVNSGEAWPSKRITVGLSPATLPKSGSALDVAIGVSVLAAAGSVPAAALDGVVFLGELGLDGRIRPVRGVLPAALAASLDGFTRFVVAPENAAEARLVPDSRVVAAPTLRWLLAFLRGEPVPEVDEPAACSEAPASLLCLSQVGGQHLARSAIEVAAAGGHHVFLTGPPGVGKTMLAERLPGLLPPLPWDWAVEVSAIHSVAGLLPPGRPLVTIPPFRAPHHSATVPAMVGGGSGSLRPGEASCAHRGVLFLDEAPEFSMGVLDALRQPLECGTVGLVRAKASAVFPARFTLVMAANPCQCATPDGTESTCTCTPMALRRYAAKLSGPLLDRVDIRVKVQRVSRADLLADVSTIESTEVVAARVAQAKAAAARRLAGTPWSSSAEVPGHELRRRWPLSRAVTRAAEQHLDKGTLSARGMDRVLRVAWTIADLTGLASPGVAEVERALGMRLEVAA